MLVCWCAERFGDVTGQETRTAAYQSLDAGSGDVMSVFTRTVPVSRSARERLQVCLVLGTSGIEVKILTEAQVCDASTSPKGLSSRQALLSNVHFFDGKDIRLGPCCNAVIAHASFLPRLKNGPKMMLPIAGRLRGLGATCRVYILNYYGLWTRTVNVFFLRLVSQA